MRMPTSGMRIGPFRASPGRLVMVPCPAPRRWLCALGRAVDSSGADGRIGLPVAGRPPSRRGVVCGYILLPEPRVAARHDLISDGHAGWSAQSLMSGGGQVPLSWAMTT
jgi:hypothetical protein